ncbi:MAG: G8 domain-containing protein, partial [Patescibacteria group bacterium]
MTQSISTGVTTLTNKILVIALLVMVSLTLNIPTASAMGIGETLDGLSGYLRELDNKLYFRANTTALAEGAHIHDNSHTHPEGLVAGAATQSQAGSLNTMMPASEATHQATRNGNWFDGTIWNNGTVPGTGARVYIPANIKVTYSGESANELNRIRVDGELAFNPAVNNRIIFDTLFVLPTGTLTVGTVSQPVTGTVDMVIADNGNIDVNWDRTQISRGIVVTGKAEMHGRQKLVHGKVATDPRQGQTSITMAENPTNWQVGDTIVIAGTLNRGYDWDGAISATRWWGTQDEVRVISGISGNTISFADPLVNNHISPRSDLKTSVANYTRNVKVREENPNVPAHQRGHVMFMHTDLVDIRYVEFNQLGRTNKSVDSKEAPDFSPMQSNSNVRGRYPFHFHRSGLNTPSNPAIAIGNSVFGSPGWGFVHHDSNAIFHDNASYDTFGAGFVAETGNEIGTWTGNIAIKAQGRQELHKDSAAVSAFDTARTGVGYWFQGRMVKSRDNVAASTNAGYVFMHRGGPSGASTGPLKFPAAVFDFPESVYEGLTYPFQNVVTDDKLVEPDATPIIGFDGNETFASSEGIHVVKANPRQGHDVRTEFTDFKGWNLTEGAHFEYTAHYTLKNFDLVGTPSIGFRGARKGISLGTNLTDFSIINPKIAGFGEGIQFNHSFTAAYQNDLINVVVVNPTITGAQTMYTGGYDSSIDRVIPTSSVVPNRFSLNLQPLSFNGSSEINVIGSKTDSLGTISFRDVDHPHDSYQFSRDKIVGIVATDGYRTSNGVPYVVLEQYFSDRFSGEEHKTGTIVSLAAVQNDVLNRTGAFAIAKNAGAITIGSRPPVANSDTFAAQPNRLNTISNVITNDTDPDGDTLRLDGIVQPRHGQAFASGNTIQYRPDFDFSGSDVIKYWVTDNNGNYTPAYISINVSTSGVQPAPIPAPAPISTTPIATTTPTPTPAPA